MEKFLKSKKMSYSLFENNLWKKLLVNIKNDFKDSKKEIEKVLKIDNKHYDFNLEFSKIDSIINNYIDYKNNNIENIEDVIILYNGNPYLTLKICLEAILNKKRVVLDPQDFMLGINRLIVTIINNNLEEYRISKNIFLENFIFLNDLGKYEVSQILCIDDNENFKLLEMMEIGNIKNVLLESISLYCDDNNYLELRNLILDYCEKGNIKINIFDDTPKNEIIDILSNYNDTAMILLLSSDKNLQEEFTNKILSSKLLINKNPFSYELNRIEDLF